MRLNPLLLLFLLLRNVLIKVVSKTIDEGIIDIPTRYTLNDSRLSYDDASDYTIFFLKFYTIDFFEKYRTTKKWMNYR